MNFKYKNYDATRRILYNSVCRVPTYRTSSSDNAHLLNKYPIVSEDAGLVFYGSVDQLPYLTHVIEDVNINDIQSVSNFTRVYYSSEDGHITSTQTDIVVQFNGGITRGFTISQLYLGTPSDSDYFVDITRPIIWGKMNNNQTIDQMPHPALLPIFQEVASGGEEIKVLIATVMAYGSTIEIEVQAVSAIDDGILSLAPGYSYADNDEIEAALNWSEDGPFSASTSNSGYVTL